MVVIKKKDGSDPICIDLMRLKKISVIDSQPVPSPDDSSLATREDRCFFKLDQMKTYHQIWFLPTDVCKIIFVTVGQHYEFLRMWFGMVNSDMTMMRELRKLLDGMDNVVH